MPIVFRRPSEHELGALLDRLSTLGPTYSETGATRGPDLPPGYRQDRHSVPLGHGDEVFRRGQQALRQWRAHRHAGANVVPADASIVEGTKVIVTLRLGPAHVVAPCEIVYVTEEDDCFGFAYGSLPGHPEQGEEAFHVSRTPGGEVSFDLVVFSRPAWWVARLGRPIARVVQMRITRAYLEGIRRFVENPN